MNSRSHIREALAQLRRWIPVAGGVVAFASLVQLFVFGFAHFTDIRWEELKAHSDTTAVVLTPTARPVSPTRPHANAPFSDRWAHAQRQLDGVAEGTPDVNRVRSSAAVVLERSSDTAVFMGVVGVVALVAMTGLGAVIAGGGAIPGIEKILGAAGGAMLLAIGSIPWSEAFPSVPIAGVFTGYSEMVAASEAARSGTSISLIAMHAVVPIVVLIGSIFIVLRFNSGVDAGFVLDDAMEAEALLQREMELIRKRGPSDANRSSNIMKTLGAPRGESTSSPLTTLPPRAAAPQPKPATSLAGAPMTIQPISTTEPAHNNVDRRAPGLTPDAPSRRPL